MFRHALPLFCLLLLGCPDREEKLGEDVELFAQFRLVEVLEGHQAPVTCVAFGEFGNRLISGDADGVVFIWNSDDSKRPVRLVAHEDAVRSVALGAGDTLALTVGGDGKCCMWSVETGEPVEIEEFTAIDAAALASDGTALLVDTEDRPVTLGPPWKCGAHATLAVLDDSVLAFSSNASVAVAGGTQPTDGVPLVRLQDLSDEGSPVKVSLPEPPLAVAAAPTMLSGAVAYPNGSVEVLDSGMTWRMPGSVASSLEFSPGGGALTAGDHDGPILIWALDDGRRLNQLVGHQGPVHDLSFQHEGLLLASGGEDETVRIWAPLPEEEVEERSGTCTNRCHPPPATWFEECVARREARDGFRATELLRFPLNRQECPNGLPPPSPTWFEQCVARREARFTQIYGGGGRVSELLRFPIDQGGAAAVQAGGSPPNGTPAGRSAGRPRNGGGVSSGWADAIRNAGRRRAEARERAQARGGGSRGGGGNARQGGPRGNNGVGNGLDPQPPGRPPVINDGQGSRPGSPGARGGPDCAPGSAWDCARGSARGSDRGSARGSDRGSDRGNARGSDRGSARGSGRGGGRRHR